MTLSLFLSTLTFITSAVISLFLGLYNYLYLKHCKETERELHISVPKFVHRIIFFNTAFSFTATAVFAFILLIMVGV